MINQALHWVFLGVKVGGGNFCCIVNALNSCCYVLQPSSCCEIKFTSHVSKAIDDSH